MKIIAFFVSIVAVAFNIWYYIGRLQTKKCRKCLIRQHEALLLLISEKQGDDGNNKGQNTDNKCSKRHPPISV